MTVLKFSLLPFRFFIVTVCVISLTYSAFACTAINLTAKDGTVIAGRTMEWGFEMKWELLALPQGLLALPQGTEIEICAPSDLNFLVTTLSSKYAFAGGKDRQSHLGRIASVFRGSK